MSAKVDGHKTVVVTAGCDTETINTCKKVLCSLLQDDSMNHFKNLQVSLSFIFMHAVCRQCFDAVGWAAGGASGL